MTTVGPQTPAVMLAQATPNMNQPRQTFDHAPMLELAQSIRSGGLVQPIVIQPGDNYHPEGTFDYTIVAGERRWRACCALAVAQHRNPGLTRRSTPEQLAEIDAWLDDLEGELGITVELAESTL